jgi:hypothetical protein
LRHLRASRVPRRRRLIPRQGGTRSTSSCRSRDRARTWAGTGGCRRASARAGVSSSSGLSRKPRTRCVPRIPGLQWPRWSNSSTSSAKPAITTTSAPKILWPQRASSCQMWWRCCGRRRGNARGSRGSPKPLRRSWFLGSPGTAGPVTARARSRRRRPRWPSCWRTCCASRTRGRLRRAVRAGAGQAVRPRRTDAPSTSFRRCRAGAS